MSFSAQKRTKNRTVRPYVKQPQLQPITAKHERQELSLSTVPVPAMYKNHLG